MNEMTFKEEFNKLNVSQRKAVRTIEGPVMVVAGPGTGKTQLLSMRVANILRSTDANPNNILCLTFTESGAAAMRQRLVKLTGQAAYGVAIHTFHSFGSEIINRYGDYFYRGAHFRPADQLSSYEALREIFDKLSHDNPLASTMNGEYTGLKDAQKAISDLKKSGLTPDELNLILDHNDSFISFAEPILSAAFEARLSKKSFTTVESAMHDLELYEDQPVPVIGYKALSELCSASLSSALSAAQDAGSTKPLTAWKNKWLEKGDTGSQVFKDRKRNNKLRALSGIYYEYLVAMQERSLYDFDDMILRVVHAMEVFADLQLNLQEQYQYVLVDEFQDTNGAQMRLLWNLTNNEQSDGRPNILVVGDDDQAIYSFQGADLGNILQFSELYRQPAVITLTDNYRSTSPILKAARALVVQGSERLESTMKGINKTLHARNDTPDAPHVSFTLLPKQSDEYFWLVNKIKARIKSGIPASDIAIIGRNHVELQRILPYIAESGLPLRYERQDNALDLPVIRLLELLAEVINDIGLQRYDVVDENLPKLLAHPSWRLTTHDVWQLSLKAYKDRRFWLEIMLESDGKLRDIAEWLIVISHTAQHEPLEIIMDKMLGGQEPQVAEAENEEAAAPFDDGPKEEYTSPIRAHFFPANGLKTNASHYITNLTALTVIRRRLREYRPDKTLLLEDFCHFIAMHRRINLSIGIGDEMNTEDEAIHVMTAHKSKGLEFDTVFVTCASDSIWGAGGRGRSGSISFPANLPLAPSGDSDDERIRLLYVALTRAKAQLFLSCHKKDNRGKEALPASYLLIPEFTTTDGEADGSQSSAIIAAEAVWHEHLTRLPKADMKQLLQPTLEHYRLSATHLNNFLDVANGGPESFLLQNLLRFPQAMSPSAAFGSSVHGALQRAHAHLSATGTKRPVEDVLHDFEELLCGHQVSKTDLQRLLQKGSDVLQNFMAQRYDSFTPDQIAERSFSNQAVTVDGVRLTGAIDLMNIDMPSRSITVTDYKTGKPATSWSGKTEFEKIKLHKYRQQLMLYKLLVENSRDFASKGFVVTSGVLQFVEPTSGGDIVALEMSYDDSELEEFKTLLKAVWNHIQSLSMPDTAQYPPTLKGILAFEATLIEKMSANSLTPLS